MFYFWGIVTLVYCDSTVIQCFACYRTWLHLPAWDTVWWSWSHKRLQKSAIEILWRFKWYPLTILRESRCCRIGYLVKYSLISVVRIFNWCFRFTQNKNTNIIKNTFVVSLSFLVKTFFGSVNYFYS